MNRDYGLTTIVAALAALAVAAASVEPGARMAVLSLGGGLLAVTAGVGLLAGERHPSARFLTRLVLAAVAVRLVLFAAIRLTVGPYVFAPDALTYEIVGMQVLRAWDLGLPLPAHARDGIQVGYYWFNGWLFSVFGEAPAAPATVNAFLGAWVAVPVYAVVLQVVRGNHGVARWAAALTAFFPSLMLWSVLNIREAPTILALALLVAAVAHLQERASLLAVLGIVAAGAVLALSREYLMVLAGTAAAAGLIAARGRSTAWTVLSGAMLLVLLTTVIRSAGIGESLIVEPSLARVQAFRADFAIGAGSAYGQEHDVSTLGGALAFLPTGLTYFLFAPFPWRVTTTLQWVTLPETLLWYALFPFVLRGAWLGLRHDARRLAVVFFVVAVVTVAYAVVEGNVGTAYRHRAQLLPLFFVLAAVGLRDAYGAWRERRHVKAT